MDVVSGTLDRDGAEARAGLVRVALIGYGRAGRVFHAPLIGAIPGLDLAIVASSRPEDVRAALPRATVVPTPEAAWARDDVDLVVIATPSNTHEELAESALRAGRHVVVDKPLALTLEGARRLAKVAADQGRILATFQNRRWDGDFLLLQDLLRRGALGEVTHCASHFDRYRPGVRDRWRERPGPGAGVWNDLGPHLADQALRLFGVPDWVTGTLAAHRHGASTDDFAHVSLGYPGRVVELHASLLVAGRLVPRFAVHGTEASWIKYGLDPQEAQLAAGVGIEPSDDPAESAELIDGITGAHTATPLPAGDYRRFYEAVRDAVQGKGQNPVPPAQAMATTALVATAARSASERRALPLALTDAERAAASA